MHEQLFGVSHGHRPNASDITIIITDGFSNVDAMLTSTYATAARADNIRMFAVAIGYQVEMNEIERIVSWPYFHHEFFVDEWSNLPDLANTINASICGGE